MILSQNYTSRYFQKMPANTGQTLPTTLRTPLNYSEMHSIYTMTPLLPYKDRECGQNSLKIVSLLMDLNSLFSKNISLIPDLKFPVNFRPHIPKTNESPLNTGRFMYTDSEI